MHAYDITTISFQYVFQTHRAAQHEFKINKKKTKTLDPLLRLLFSYDYYRTQGISSSSSVIFLFPDSELRSFETS